jgi:hypothetical protein
MSYPINVNLNLVESLKGGKKRTKNDKKFYK